MKPIRGGLLSGVVALVLLALSPEISWATYPGANGLIAYSLRSDSTGGDSEIFTVLPDGSGVQRLTSNTVSDFEPSWSADGRRLVYRSGIPPIDPDFELFTKNATAGNRTRVTHDNGNDSSPGFSPNGRRIVYAKDGQAVTEDGRPRRVSIFKIRTDGTDRRRLVTGVVQEPTYSPNGNRIVFHGIPKGRSHGGIWTVRRDGSHLRRLTNPDGPYIYDLALDWSPDGHHILFLRCDAFRAACDHWLMRPNGSNKHPIPGTGEQPIQEASGTGYSPSGNRLAFWWGEGVGSDDFPCSDIYTVPTTGYDSELVTHVCEDLNNGGPGGYAIDPSWQPIPQP